MKIGILVFPAVEELDFVGPWEMFGMWGLIGTSVFHSLRAGPSRRRSAICSIVCASKSDRSEIVRPTAFFSSDVIRTASI